MNECDFCQSRSIRQPNLPAGRPLAAICSQCGTVFNLAGAQYGSTSVSHPVEKTIREFRGYALDVFESGVYGHLLRELLVPGQRVLDIGCFDGRFLAFAQARGCDAVGLEMLPDMAAFCREQGLAVSAGTIPNDVPAEIRENRYDLITALETIYYWEDLNRCADIICELLADGGILLVKTCQGTSQYFDGGGSYWERVHDFRALSNVDALKILFGRHGLEFVGVRAFTYIYDRRRYHPIRFLRVWFRGLAIVRSLWAAAAREPREWDKVVVLFRKPVA